MRDTGEHFMKKSNEENKALIAGRVRLSRCLAGLTQLDVAEKLGLTPQAISNYERGVNSIPNNVMQQMATLYKTSTDYLLGVEDNRAYFSKATTDILGDDVANIPTRYSKYVDHLCTQIQCAVSVLVENSPDLLPYADQCLNAAIDSFLGLSDLFLDTPTNEFEPVQYQEKGIEKINKMVLPFYEFLIFTRDTRKQALEKDNSQDG